MSWIEDPERVKAVVSELVRGLRDETDAAVPPTATFEELGVDSMSTMDLLFKVEREFGVEVPDDKLPTITTVEALVGYITAARRADANHEGETDR